MLMVLSRLPLPDFLPRVEKMFLDGVKGHYDHGNEVEAVAVADKQPFGK